MPKTMINLKTEAIELIIQSFREIGIEPTNETNDIKDAFRKKAVVCHPDKASSESEERQFHTQFIKLTEARDVCLRAALIPDLLLQLSNDKPPANAATDQFDFPSEQEDYESEWRVFVDDADAYTNIFTKSRNTVSTIIHMLFFSLIYSTQLMVSIVLISTFVVAAISSSIAIPLIGWILGILFLGKLFESIGNLYTKSQQSILKSLSKTGFPYNFFVSGWLTANILVTSGFSLKHGLSYFVQLLLHHAVPFIISMSLVPVIIWLRKALHPKSAIIFSICCYSIFCIAYSVYPLVSGFSYGFNLYDTLYLYSILCLNIGYAALFIGTFKKLSDIQSHLSKIRSRVNNRSLVLVTSKPTF